ncbi:MAG: hypothetical protein GY708_21835 [Actinomycetia bacterium]|nr:hypothetical protein [Actinomycetes bacterium]MCP4958637.1 hypothetical protein [Actinomycetes bacterium]
MSASDGARQLLPLPVTGRHFSTTRKVRLGDTTPKGRLRFDAIARYLQDVANDDARDADLDDAMWWILRRTKLVVDEPIRFDEWVTLTTWCSGFGGRWAERRTELVGDMGGRVEAVALWVFVDRDTGAPRRLAPEFIDVYGEACAGRKVRARLFHDDPPIDASTEPWHVRYVDLDVIGHVNNAVYWAAVEESMADSRTGGRVRASVEFRSGIEARSEVILRRSTTESGESGWFDVDGGIAASYRWVIS